MNVKHSFTLVELMIVIAILAIISAVVIFTLNPSEIFKKNRDSIRLADMKTVYKAISFIEAWNTSGVNIGDAETVYLSLPDSSNTCSSYELPSLPTGFAYSCKATDTYKNSDGTGWIPINFSVTDDNAYVSSLPIDPLNTIDYYYSYNPGGSFEVSAFLESNEYITRYASTDGGDSSNAYEQGTSLTAMPLTFPHNWVKVPGSSLYNTSDFYVMQYEAKYSIDSRTGSDVPVDCRSDASYDTYDWNKVCSQTANEQTNVISSPVGSPIAGVSHIEAKAICEAIGAHLITNPEWMTIARNIDQQAENWTSGVVGSGYLINGNSGWTSAGYKAFSDRHDADKGNNRNERASHTLSNNNKIYDFSGNLFEHVMVDSNDLLLDSLPNDGGASGWRWIELTAITNYGDFEAVKNVGPTNSSWNANQSMGRIYTNSGVQSDRVLVRGGRFYDYDYTGVYAADLSWASDYTSYNTGFRCAK